MTARLAHLQINVDRENLDFYQELATSLGWTTIHADDGILGLASRPCCRSGSVDQGQRCRGD
ncbi:MAG: hypothetical protein R2845_02770 [Thermomicrobiales bacterium]